MDSQLAIDNLEAYIIKIDKTFGKNENMGLGSIKKIIIGGLLEQIALYKIGKGRLQK